MDEDQLPPADLWEQKRQQGLSGAAATAYVNASLQRRQASAPVAGRPPAPRVGVVAGINEMLGQGLTMGYGDEIAAGINAAVNAPFSEETFGQIYNREVGANRERARLFRRERPATAIAAELAGGVAGVVATGGLGEAALGARLLGGAARAGGAARQISTVGRLGRLAAEGAAYGAVAGSGYAEGGARARLRGARDGAVVGAVAGPVLYGAGRAGGAVLSRVADAVPGVRPAQGRLMRRLGKAAPQAEEVVAVLPERAPEAVPVEPQVESLDVPAVVPEAVPAPQPGGMPREASSAGESGYASSPIMDPTLNRGAGTQAEPFHSSTSSGNPGAGENLLTRRMELPSRTGSMTGTGMGSELGSIDASSGKLVVQPSSDAGELLRRASEMHPDYSALLDKVAEAVPGATSGGARVKTNAARLGGKLQEQPANTIPDYLAGRIVLDDMAQREEVLQRVRQLGWRDLPGAAKDRTAEPTATGYLGQYAQVYEPVQIVGPNGLTAELQITPREFAEINDVSHALYRTTRDTSVPVDARARAVTELRALHDGARRRYEERVAAPSARTEKGGTGGTTLYANPVGDPKAVGDALRGTAQEVGRGLGALRGALVRGVDDVAMERLAAAIERSGKSVDEIAAALEGSDKPLTLMEAGGDAVRRVARGVHTTPGAGAQVVADALEGRMQTQLGRVERDAATALGADRSRGYLATLDELTAQRAQRAQPLYEAAFQRGPVEDEQIAQLLGRPSMRKAYGRAREIAAEQGAPLGELVQGQMPDVRTLHYMKLALDDMLALGRRGGSTAEGGIGPTLAREVGSTRAALLERLDAQVPEYAQARSTYAGDSALRDALAQGREALKLPAEELERTMAGLGESEREMYRRGVLEQMMARAEESADGSNLARKMWNSEAVRKRLRAVFGDEGRFNAFAQAMEEENAMAQSRNFVTTGSATADKLQDVAELGGGPMLEQAAQAAGSGNLRGYLMNQMLRSGASRLVQGRTERLGEALAPLVTTGANGDRAATQRLIEMLREYQTVQGGRVATRRARATRSAGVVSGASRSGEVAQ